ncbi:ABC transporter permease [Nitrosovibrio sp. Nv17]|uniref:ABC transporter permease n=1 Tax=Nitrosovibrio sp. Nv17 TaxID=1855339 RepID=UPI000908F626|nr:ABC transporter permease [Nitrosovibrio sp. Nv17]SFW29684.1 putative ABC transport system permease protein [Nitrosovibrio sp. Nv17]
MNPLAIIGEALRALRLNRLRTGLTMLGMIIGVAAVVLMLAVGQGAQTAVNQAISSMGSNLFIVIPGATSSGVLRSGAGGVQTLTMADAQAITHLPSVKATAPLLGSTAQINHGANNWSTSVTGVTPDFFRIRDWPLERGAFFTETDLRAAARAAILGQVSAENLFGTDDPIGRTIRIQNSPFTVVGILAPKGRGLDGNDQDDAVFIPITTGQRQIFGTQFPDTIRFMMIQAVSAEAMDEAEREINQLLRQRHRITEGAENDFTVRNMAAIAAVATGAARIMSITLGSIASISLLVGGIGIMNIMLVSVTERTREIGIRMAIGANRRAILAQFLLEAMVICILGGLIGIALGIGGAWAVSMALDMVVVITLGTVLLAFTFASAVGIFFGFYPAKKAAALRPVEALRYE